VAEDRFIGRFVVGHFIGGPVLHGLADRGRVSDKLEVAAYKLVDLLLAEESQRLATGGSALIRTYW
jgi:hypothetical protein